MMSTPEPMLSPEDDGRDAPDLSRVLGSLSASNLRLLGYMRLAVRLELGEGGRPVLPVISADISFEPLDVFWLVHFGVLTLHVDDADRVFLVKTDLTDLVCGYPCKPKRRRYQGQRRK